MEQEKKPAKTVKAPKADKPAPAKAAKAPSGKVAAILLRNTVGASGQIEDTLKMLRLLTKFSCSVFDNTDTVKGMLRKVKDYVTYGEIDEETLKELQQKKGKKGAEGKMLMTFRLPPPRGGLERKGIKHSFAQGGALGYRGAKINDMIKKML